MKTLRNVSLFLIVPVILAFPTADLLDGSSCDVNREDSCKVNCNTGNKESCESSCASDCERSCATDGTELEQLPAFEIQLLDSGKTFNSGNLNGKYTLIDVWSPACGVCIEHVPALRELHKNYGAENFEIVSIALSTEEKVRQFRNKKHRMPWKHALAEKSRDGEIVQALEVKSTPTYYFVSPEGEVLATNEDFQDEGSFDGIIDQYL